MQTLVNLFSHMYWANERLLAALRTQPAHSTGLRLFTHLLQAEVIWLTRLQGTDSSAIPLWPLDPSLESCEELVKHNRELYETFLVGMTEEQLDQTVRYRNQSGAPFENTLRDILTHVALHGQYHRGQINMRLREAGGEPVNLDYILFVRSDKQ